MGKEERKEEKMKNIKDYNFDALKEELKSIRREAF